MQGAPTKLEDITDPRQLRCLALYRDPTSETFGNLKGSALLAGYSETYADTLSVANPPWLSVGAQKDVERVKKAEENIDKYINVKIDLASGDYDIDLAKVQVDVSKFLLKTLARKKYSEDAEVTPPNVHINIVNYNAKKDGDQAKGEAKEAEVK